MDRFYRHVLIADGYPHHGAVAFGHAGKALHSVMTLLGIARSASTSQGMLYPRRIRSRNASNTNGAKGR
jgi:hypothetical protein